MLTQLDGKVVLVTGGSSGIGRAIAVSLASAGAQVVITGRREAALRETCEAATGTYPVRYRVADVADPDQVSQLVAWVRQEVGAIDILVNNAGVNIKARSLASLSVADWAHVLDINANGAYYVIHAVLPAMRDQGGGLIINISSMAGVRGSSVAGAAYSASKHALNALTEVITLEERANGIRATSICPGAVNTPILDERPEGMSAEQREKILQPEDIADAVKFVATLPERAHVTELRIVPAT